MTDQTVVEVCPGVVRPDGEGAGVEDGEPVHDVGAELRPDVSRLKLCPARPVPGPVSEVANYLVISGYFPLHHLALIAFLLLVGALDHLEVNDAGFVFLLDVGNNDDPGILLCVPEVPSGRG